MEAVGQLTSGMAHDFTNLLMVIAGSLELIDKSDQSERRQRLSIRMREAVSRAAPDRTPPRLRPPAAARRSRGGRERPRRHDERRHAAHLGASIRLETRLDPTLAPCFADQRQMEVALVNLLLNAHDAVPQGGVVTVMTGRLRLGPEAPEVVAGEVPAGDYVSSVVADAGAGMPPEVLDRATEPFFTTKDNGPGSGLVLSTVHRFAQQSRGHPVPRSQPGHGTSVRLLFPCSATSAEAHEAPHGCRRVLLADPDPYAREAVMALLDSRDPSAIHVGSALGLLC